MIRGSCLCRKVSWEISVGSMAPWYEIADDLPQLDEVAGGSGANVLPR